MLDELSEVDVVESAREQVVGFGHDLDAFDGAIEPLSCGGGEVGLVDGEEADDACEVVLDAVVEFAEEDGFGLGVAAGLLVEQCVFDSGSGAGGEDLREVALGVGEKARGVANEQENSEGLVVGAEEGCVDDGADAEGVAEIRMEGDVGGSVFDDEHLSCLEDSFGVGIGDGEAFADDVGGGLAGGGGDGHFAVVVVDEADDAHIDAEGGGHEFGDGAEGACEGGRLVDGGVDGVEFVKGFEGGEVGSELVAAAEAVAEDLPEGSGEEERGGDTGEEDEFAELVDARGDGEIAGPELQPQGGVDDLD